MEKARYYRRIVEEFLNARGWTDFDEIDADEDSVQYQTPINVAGHDALLSVTVVVETDICEVSIYLGLMCQNENFVDIAILLNSIHQRWHFGRFVLLEDGKIRWQHRSDFEGCQPTGTSINNIVNQGWGAVAKFIEPIISVESGERNADSTISLYFGD